jgi:DNA replication and repair protein RecF
MYLKSLRLYNFRNFKELDTNFAKGINIFYGNNAQGKTNLLESIFFLAGLRPLGTTPDIDLIRHNNDKAYARGVFATRTGNVDREVTIFSNKRKIVKEGDIVKDKRSQLYGNISTVFFSPDDLSLVKGEPSKRRRFIDSIVCQTRPSYYKYLSGYYRVLSHRNKLLKSLKKNVSGAGLLDPWDEQLSEFGTRIVVERADLIKKIYETSLYFFNKFTKSDTHLSIKYICCVDYGQPEKIKGFFLESLKECRKTDIMRTYTTFGPHRDDLMFLIGSRDAKAFASQGQQRLLVLCLKFAQKEIINNESGEYPILLLDDVMSELDATKRELILKDEMQQVFLTTTDVNLIPRDILKKGFVFYISDGELRLN